MGVRVERVGTTKDKVGEGAVWDDRAGVLWWLDIPEGVIHQLNPVTGDYQSYNFGEPIGCLAVRESGGLVLAAKSGFWFFDPQSGVREPISDPEADQPSNRFNDGATDPQGRFWAGSLREGGASDPHGRFYRLDADLSVTPWKDGFYTTNGATFSPDGRTMYYSDSNPAVRTIWAAEYDPDTGTPGASRVFFDTRDVAGRPDGGTVDADGCYWMAGVSGWQLYRITPDGQLDLTIDMPIEKPTKPMFGGPNLDTLYVTSIGAHLTPGTEDRQPDAGGLFAVTGLGVTGIRQTRFKG